MNRLLAAACLAPLAAFAQGEYGERPLRSDLTDKPFGQTAGGREGHRFAGEEVNKYRIYDFYARQARWHLEHPEDKSELLLPFTGLDGGRRGHWGVTNEISTEALKRTVPPEFPACLARGEFGLHHLRGGSSAHPGVLVYDVRRPGLQLALADAALSSPTHFLCGKVDRWGFNLKTEGRRWISAPDQEWSGVKESPRYLGHYLHGNRTVYRNQVGASLILDCPEALDLQGLPLIARHFSFENGAAGLKLALSGGSGEVTQTPQGLLLSNPFHRHLVWGRGVEFRTQQHGLEIVKAEPGAQLHVLTWTGPAEATTLAALRALPAPEPRCLTSKAPARWPQTLTLAGKLDADPAARGGAYVIDDLPVPVDNPWNAPMTLSGIAFDAQGQAWVTTLVGDVWRVSGIDASLAQVTWKRYASGLNFPLGIEVVDGVPHVSCRGMIVKLHDKNGDGEADYVERFSRQDLPADEAGHDLARDAQGRFYVNSNAGIFRLSPDGAVQERIGEGSRNPLGIGVRPDGLAISDSSEGDKNNGTCTLYEAEHASNSKSPANRKRILYLPRGLDNSSGSRLFVDDPRFGPLGKSLVGVTFGASLGYLILRDDNDGTPQAAMLPLPGDYASGVMRLRTSPADGQLYTLGLDGWGDYAVAEGSFHRLRYTGAECLLPSSWQAHRNGILVTFNREVDASALKPEAFFAQQWNVVDSLHTYGSPDYSVRHPEKIGHDRLRITRILPQPDRRSVFFEIPELLPAQFTQIHGRLRAASGPATLELELYATINRLRPDFPGAAPGLPAGKPSNLVSPQKDGNGNTYQQVTGFFDQIAGRTAVQRPVAPEVAWRPEELNYQWIKTHLIDKQCIFCHAKGTPHDFSSYATLKRHIRPGDPAKSPLCGMVQTQSMPPFPMPSVPPGVQKALEEWIRKGAPE